MPNGETSKMIMSFGDKKRKALMQAKKLSCGRPKLLGLQCKLWCTMLTHSRYLVPILFSQGIASPPSRAC